MIRDVTLFHFPDTFLMWHFNFKNDFFINLHGFELEKISQNGCVF